MTIKVVNRENINQPLWLLAEVTYRCPLHCVFCYNPVDYAKQHEELDTKHWLKVLNQGRELGAAQLGISGGEPLLRSDLEEIVSEARSLGYYINLITSGIGLTEKRIENLKKAGLDHIQLSFQDSTKEMNDFLSSTKTFELKNKVAGLIKKYDYPMVLNCVLHRLNIDHIREILNMAENMGAEYVELANTQFYSWASLNKKQLMPTKKQCDHAEVVAKEFRERLGNKMKIYFVMPDYYSKRPKKCMNGWGNVFITVQADGTVLPCHVAGMLPNVEFSNVKEETLEWIWYDSPSFNLFRGDDWMKEPCKSCPEKEKDLGGCRCQAYMLAGDASLTDPICEKSPNHTIVRNVVKDAELLDANEKPIIFRTDSESRRLMNEKVSGKLKLEDSRLFEEEAIASAEKSRVGSL